MQLIQYRHVSLFSTVITNKFIGEEFHLGHTSINGYEAMRFNVTQLTSDEVQRIFTIKTNKPIPMLVSGDSFQWEKYGHHIHPPSLDLRSLNKGSLHQIFWNSLIEFLCIDLDGNLSSTWILLLLPGWVFFIKIFEGLSETANKGKKIDQHLLSEKSKDHFIDEIKGIALFATQIPLSIFTIYSNRGLKSIQCWNQRLKYYSSSMFKWRHNLMNFTFLLEIFPHTCYGVRDLASMLLFMVQLETLHSMHLLQCYITGTWFNPMTSKFAENWCWCPFFSPLMKIMYDQ